MTNQFSFLFFLFALSLFSCKKIYITEVTHQPVDDSILPLFTSFSILASDNPAFLNDSVSFAVNGNTLSTRIPYFTNVKELIPTFETNIGLVYVNDELQEPGKSVQDFTNDVLYTIVTDDGVKKEFTVRVTNFTGLPVMKIGTEGNAAIDKSGYTNATLTIDGNGVVEDFSGPTGIKGRGNSTWAMPKKPYTIKLDKNASLMGMPAHKKWVLLANYSDKTQLRTHASFFLGRSSSLQWSSSSQFVELFLNERYMGTYELTEKIEVDENRVNIGKDGYLIEVDVKGRMKPDDIWFTGVRDSTYYTTDPTYPDSEKRVFCVKSPKIQKGDEKYKYIVDYINLTESKLGNHDPNEGYRKYLDVESFVDWYLVNEITKNPDANFYSSVYMNLVKGGKLKMGPIWDFDISFGNFDHPTGSSPTGYWIMNNSWIGRLFDDAYFRSQVKERFNYYYANKDEILHLINSNAAKLKWSIIENNNKWKVLYQPTWPNYAVWGNYDNEVMYMKDWFIQRMEWLKTAFERY